MEINFIPTENNEKLLAPVPAITQLPDWYKNLSPFTGKDKKEKAYPDFRKNLTIKRCNPFGDALSAGYFILLENDIQFSLDNDVPRVVWHRGGENYVKAHSLEQLSGYEIPPEYSHDAFKFKNYWKIKTSPGYSVLITHPQNRPELPFLTLSGVIDTDTFPMAVQFPFFIKKDFEGVVPSGTPIAQIIPFKRDNWKSKISQFDQKQLDRDNASFWRTIRRPYKTFFWHRKEYK